MRINNKLYNCTLGWVKLKDKAEISKATNGKGKTWVWSWNFKIAHTFA